LTKIEYTGHLACAGSFHFPGESEDSDGGSDNDGDDDEEDDENSITNSLFSVSYSYTFNNN
jgi:hypothetical protein